MAEGLRAKDPTGTVAVTIGDMTTTRVEGAFRLVYLVYNTIGNVTNPGRASRLLPECRRSPRAWRLLRHRGRCARAAPPAAPGGDAIVFAHAPGYVGYDRYVDLGSFSRRCRSHFHTGINGSERFPAPFRYVWPSELDLMARLAGMSLRHRWSGWDRATVHRCEPLARLGVAVAGLTWQTRSPGAPQVNPPRVRNVTQSA